MDMTKVNVLRNNNLISQPLTFHEFTICPENSGEAEVVGPGGHDPLDLKKWERKHKQN